MGSDWNYNYLSNEYSLVLFNGPSHIKIHLLPQINYLTIISLSSSHKKSTQFLLQQSQHFLVSPFRPHSKYSGH